MLILILACFGCVFVLIDFHLVSNYYSPNVAQSIRDLNYKYRQLSCGFFGGVGCIHWQNMPTPCLRGRSLPRFWPTRCVGYVRRLRGSYAVLFGADLFFLFADEWGLLGLHFFHFELLGIHFLSFWPFGPVRLSFPFILAFWVFISFHCHFGVAQVCTSTGCGCHHIQ